MLAEAADVIRQARTVALDMANSGVSPEEMDAQVEVVTADLQPAPERWRTARSRAATCSPATA